MSIPISDIKFLTEKEYEKFKDLIYKSTGIFLKDSKQELVNSRLLKRLRTLEMKSFGDYYKYLTTQDNGSELMEMINCITTNKTDFFRENNHFEFMQKYVLLKLKQECYSAGKLSIKAWCAASSTGEEPYTIAMVLRDFFSAGGWDIKILASDIDTNVLQKANTGVYTDEQVLPVPYDKLKNYFYKGEGEHQGLFKVKNNLKQMITFRKINLIDEIYPISSPLDIIFCRNVFIYFDQETINTILNRFYRYLRPGGYLFLGHSESIDTNEIFKGKYKIIAHTVYERL